MKPTLEPRRRVLPFLVAILAVPTASALRAEDLEPLVLEARTFTATFERDEFRLVHPFQREVQVWATVRNRGPEDDVLAIELARERGRPSPAGRVRIGAGQEIPVQVAHIEPRMSEGTNSLALVVAMRSTRWPDSSGEAEIRVEFVDIPVDPRREATIRVQVEDATSGEALNSAWVSWSLGAESRWEAGRPRRDGEYECRVPPREVLRREAERNGLEWSGYSLQVLAEGFSTWARSGVLPESGQPIEVRLQPLAGRTRYRSAWKRDLDYPGVWRVRAARDWDAFAVALGKHPDSFDPRGPVPTNVYLFRGDGELAWRREVDDAVWGIDLSADGSLVAAGTPSGTYQVFDSAGESLWREEGRGNVRELRFSNDGNLLAGETSREIRILDAKSGEVVTTLDPGTDTHWRAVSFDTGDGRAVFAGAGGLVLCDLERRSIVWQRYVAQVPWDARIASGSSNVAVADKGGCVWLYGPEGDLLWHKRGIPVTTDMDASDDGTRIGVLSHDGTLRVFDDAGAEVWTRNVGFAGHNALDMTGDGGLYLVGGGTRDRPYAVFLFDRDGNLVWTHDEPGSIPEPYHPYMTSTMSVAIAEDGTKLLAGYGTGSPGIQLFERVE